MAFTAKAFEEMNIDERHLMFETVAAALEQAAQEAEDEGDLARGHNSLAVAGTLRGLSTNLDDCDVHAAELLLEQGVMLLHEYSLKQAGPDRLQ
jgi:hypothetical protein